jgi:hypothetical protein
VTLSNAAKKINYFHKCLNVELVPQIFLRMIKSKYSNGRLHKKTSPI